jgi:hypothetical protein
MFLTPTSNAQPYGYAGGGYPPGYGPEGYSVYGQGPYVYRPPAGYSYPVYGGYYQGYGAGPYGYGSPRLYPRLSYSAYRAYSPYNMSLYSRPYDDPHYAPYGLRSRNAYYQSRYGY